MDYSVIITGLIIAPLSFLLSMAILWFHNRWGRKHMYWGDAEGTEYSLKARIIMSIIFAIFFTVATIRAL